MSPPETPKPPRLAPIVFAEALFYPLILSVLSTLIWNYIGAPAADLGTVPYFTVLAGYLIGAQVFLVIGLQLGYGLSRRQLAENEEYGRAAAQYLDAVDPEDDELTPPTYGGQG